MANNGYDRVVQRLEELDGSKASEKAKFRIGDVRKLLREHINLAIRHRKLEMELEKIAEKEE